MKPEKLADLSFVKLKVKVQKNNVTRFDRTDEILDFFFFLFFFDLIMVRLFEGRLPLLELDTSYFFFFESRVQHT